MKKDCQRKVTEHSCSSETLCSGLPPFFISMLSVQKNYLFSPKKFSATRSILLQLNVFRMPFCCVDVPSRFWIEVEHEELRIAGLEAWCCLGQMFAYFCGNPTVRRTDDGFACNEGLREDRLGPLIQPRLQQVRHLLPFCVVVQLRHRFVPFIDMLVDTHKVSWAEDYWLAALAGDTLVCKLSVGAGHPCVHVDTAFGEVGLDVEVRGRAVAVFIEFSQGSGDGDDTAHEGAREEDRCVGVGVYVGTQGSTQRTALRLAVPAERAVVWACRGACPLRPLMVFTLGMSKYNNPLWQAPRLL